MCAVGAGNTKKMSTLPHQKDAAEHRTTAAGFPSGRFAISPSIELLGDADDDGGGCGCGCGIIASAIRSVKKILGEATSKAP